MPRIPYVTAENAPPELRDAMDKLPALNIIRLCANSPAACEASMRFGGALLGSPEIDGELRELVILRVGHLSAAPYEIQQHEAIARALGIPDAKLAGLAQGPDAPVFDGFERAVLAVTDEIVTRGTVGAAAWAPVAERLSRAGQVELVMVIGFYMTMCRVMNVLEVDLETKPADLSGIVRLIRGTA